MEHSSPRNSGHGPAMALRWNVIVSARLVFWIILAWLQSFKPALRSISTQKSKPWQTNEILRSGLMTLQATYFDCSSPKSRTVLQNAASKWRRKEPENISMINVIVNRLGRNGQDVHSRSNFQHLPAVRFILASPQSKPAPDGDIPTP